MQIEKLGSGPWPQVAVNGVAVTLTVGDQSKTYNCADLQQDEPVTVDVVLCAAGAMAEGVSVGVAYVANLILPAADYMDAPSDGSDIGTARVRAPLTATGMEAVRVVLWTVEGQ
jgi:hypothetical protein